MKVYEVYEVINDDGGDCTTEAIFSTKEKAFEWANSVKKYYPYWGFFVSERELDKGNDYGKVVLCEQA